MRHEQLMCSATRNATATNPYTITSTFIYKKKKTRKISSLHTTIHRKYDILNIKLTKKIGFSLDYQLLVDTDEYIISQQLRRNPNIELSVKFCFCGFFGNLGSNDYMNLNILILVPDLLSPTSSIRQNFI